MNRFHPISAKDFDFSPFRLIGEEWMLIAAEKGGKANTMTASWGGFGVLWNRNAAWIFVRKSRYTKEFVDSSDTFSLNFFDHQKYAKMLAYIGTVSGRNEDKIAKAGLTVAHLEGTPYFDEAEAVIRCKKLCDPIPLKSFLYDTIDREIYADKDYHDMYIGEITHVLQREHGNVDQ